MAGDKKQSRRCVRWVLPRLSAAILSRPSVRACLCVHAVGHTDKSGCDRYSWLSAGNIISHCSSQHRCLPVHARSHTPSHEHTLTHTHLHTQWAVLHTHPSSSCSSSQWDMVDASIREPQIPAEVEKRDGVSDG